MSKDFPPPYDFEAETEADQETLAIIRRRTMEIRIKRALEEQKVDTSTVSKRLEDHVFDSEGSFFAPLAEKTLEQVQLAEQKPPSDTASVEKVVLWQQYHIAHAASELAVDCIPLLHTPITEKQVADTQSRLIEQLESNTYLNLDVKSAFRAIIEHPGPNTRHKIGNAALRDS